MGTRITHLKSLPKGVDYWDYYILCRLNNHASRVLQQFEYWDSTKSAGNLHAEQINEQLAEVGERPTQDTSLFVYKTSEELTWELHGACSEKTVRQCLELLLARGYLKKRFNPYNKMDRTLQYEFQETRITGHLDRLNSIVKHFLALGRKERPVLYAIEQLTELGYDIEQTQKEPLSIELVARYLRAMHRQLHEEPKKKSEESSKKKQQRMLPPLPRFIRVDLKKDESQGFSATRDIPFGNFTESENELKNEQNASVQNETMHSVKLPNAVGKITEAIPITTSTVTTSNSNYEEERERTTTDDDGEEHGWDGTPPPLSEDEDSFFEDEGQTPVSSSSQKENETTPPNISLLRAGDTRDSLSEKKRVNTSDKQKPVRIGSQAQKSHGVDEVSELRIAAEGYAVASEVPVKTQKQGKKQRQQPLFEQPERTVVPQKKLVDIPLQMPDLDGPTTVDLCLALFDFLRQVPVIGKSNQESFRKDAVDLVFAKYTLREMYDMYELMKKDPYWDKRGVDLPDVAHHSHEYGPKVRKQSKSSTQLASQDEGTKVIAYSPDTQYIVDAIEELANKTMAAYAEQECA